MAITMVTKLQQEKIEDISKWCLTEWFLGSKEYFNNPGFKIESEINVSVCFA